MHSADKLECIRALHRPRAQSEFHGVTFALLMAARIGAAQA